MAEDQLNEVAQPPVAGLGVDIVEIERVERVLERTPRFKERVYTESERAYCERSHRPGAHYATHFAAKEAVSKALGTGFSAGIDLTDIEVGHDDRGRPVVQLHGAAQCIAEAQGVIEVRISLSRTHGTAVANAIAITHEAQPKREEKPSRRDDIALAFKELRGMLDELDEVQDASEGAEDAGVQGLGEQADA